MKVILIPHRFPAASETFIASLFERLLQRGGDAHVVCSESPPADWAFYPSLVEHRHRVRVAWPVTPRWLALLLVPVVLVRCLSNAPLRTMRYLVRGRRRFGLRVVRTLYADAELIILGPDIVHFQFGVYAAGREHLAELLGCAVVVSFQGADLNYAGLDKPGYYDEVFRCADAFHFLGTDLRRRAIGRGYTDGGRDMVIKPGIDATRFTPAPRGPLADRPLRILAVGRLHWKKGYEFALDAVRRLIDAGVPCEYRVIGDGDFRPAVERAIDDFGLRENVTLLGSVPLDRVREEMQRADVLLHAATSEGFCYVALEAQAMQLPVVTSDADGLPENVADGHTGFVVPRRDPAALAARLHELAVSEDLRARMGLAGRQRVLEAFDPDRQIEGFETLYRLACRQAVSP